MELSVIAYLVLLCIVAVLRLYELRISRLHQQEMIARGASKVEEPRFRWMVVLHTGVLIGAAAEVVFLKRPFIPFLAAVCFPLFLAANAVRWWVIRTLGEHWNVQVMNSTGLGVITSGPFRYVRHPNYAAVFTEMLVARPAPDSHRLDHRNCWFRRPYFGTLAATRDGGKGPLFGCPLPRRDVA